MPFRPPEFYDHCFSHISLVISCLIIFEILLQTQMDDDSSSN